MEEKKRYEIHIYDDICVDLYDKGVLDKSINDTYKLEELLNQQSKRIKELEDLVIEYKNKLYRRLDQVDNLIKENQQLKQQLHELPKKIVGEIKLQLFNHFEVKNIEEYEKLPLIDCLFTADTVIEILDTILKKFGDGQ